MSRVTKLRSVLMIEIYTPVLQWGLASLRLMQREAARAAGGHPGHRAEEAVPGHQAETHETRRW